MKKNEKKGGISERDLFLESVREIAKYWAMLPGKTEREVADGVAFSILVMLDGENAACGPYAVRAIDGKGKEGGNIAGSLHDLLYSPNFSPAYIGRSGAVQSASEWPAAEAVGKALVSFMSSCNPGDQLALTITRNQDGEKKGTRQ